MRVRHAKSSSYVPNGGLSVTEHETVYRLQESPAKLYRALFIPDHSKEACVWQTTWYREHLPLCRPIDESVNAGAHELDKNYFPS